MRLPRSTAAWLLAAGLVFVGAQAQAQDFNWRKHQGKTVTFLVNDNPIGNALVEHKPEFEKLTGIAVKGDGYQEQQMRQRLVTVMNARSAEHGRAQRWFDDMGALCREAGVPWVVLSAGVPPAQFLRVVAYAYAVGAMKAEGEFCSAYV
jgi:hypothetical protein